MSTIHVLIGGKPNVFGPIKTRRYFTTEAAARAALPDLVLSGELVGPVSLEEAELHGLDHDDTPADAALRGQLVRLRYSLREALGITEDVEVDDNGLVDHVEDLARGARITPPWETSQGVDPELERRRRAVEDRAKMWCTQWLNGAVDKGVERLLAGDVEALREYAPAETPAPLVEPDELDTFGENTAALADIARTLGLDEDTSAPDLASAVRTRLERLPAEPEQAPALPGADIIGEALAARSAEQAPAPAGVRAELHELVPLPWCIEDVDRRAMSDASGERVLHVSTGALLEHDDERVAALLVQLVNGAEPAAPPADEPAAGTGGSEVFVHDFDCGHDPCRCTGEVSQ